MSKKQIYYLQSCDDWKSNESMKLLFIGTSSLKLRNEIAKEILEGNMEYCNSDIPSKEQKKLFLKDWKIQTRDYINSNLSYGFFDYTYDNEEM